MKSDNYFTTKLILVVKKSLELKTIHEDIYVLDKNTSLKLVADVFNEKNNTEQHIVNTLNYHVKNIIRPVFENQVLLGPFFNGVCISIINALMTDDKHSKYLFKRVVNLICDPINFQTTKLLTTSDYNKSKVLLEEYFLTKPKSGLATVDSLSIESDALELHKKVFFDALSLTFEKYAESSKFKLNLELNIVKCYESELFKKVQEKDIESYSVNIYDETDDEEYYESDSNEYDNATNNQYYNDDLDMDQQSPEFWDSL